MKGFFYFILAIAFIVGAISAFWWVSDDSTLDDQIETVKNMVQDNVDGTAASNTAESASKLGKVLKHNFEEAQDVYEQGAEANY